MKGDSVVYNRAHPEEPDEPTDWNGWPVLGLEGLRARVHDLAFGKVAQDA